MEDGRWVSVVRVVVVEWRMGRSGVVLKVILWISDFFIRYIEKFISLRRVVVS